MKKHILVLGFLFFGLAFVARAQTINLNRQDIYVRKGFDRAWLETIPSDTGDWLHIPGRNGSRSLIVKKLGLKNIPSHHFLSFKIHPSESFSFITSFNIDTNPSELPSMSLFLRSIASNWEIFLNGVSIEKEMNYNDRGEMIPKRGKGLHILIPANLIRRGENILYYHIISDPTGYGAGFYYGEPYTIGPTKDLLSSTFRLFSVSHFAIYLVIAVAWIYLFIRQPKHSGLDFSFAILSLSFAAYNAIKAYYDLSSGVYSFVSFRLEYMLVFFIALMFALVINIYLKHKITLFTKVYCSVCALFILLSTRASPSFMFDLLRSWQFFLPFMSGYLTFMSIGGLRTNIKYAESSLELPNHWKIIPVKEVAFISVVIAILLITVLFDAFDSLFLKRGLIINRFGFLIWTFGMAAVLFNHYINAQKKVEKWNETLEREVTQRTRELRKLNKDIETIFTTSGDGIAKFSLDLELQRFNNSFCNLFGYTRKEVENLNIETYYDEEDLLVVLENRALVLEKGYASFRVKAKHKDGRYIYLNITGATINNSSGNPTAIVINMKNVTGEVKAEKKLMESKENLEAIFTALPDLYFRFNKHGTYLDYYGQKDLLYGSESKLIGKTVAETLPRNVSDIIMNALGVVIKEKKRVTVEYELEIKGTHKVFEAAVLPFHEDEVISGVRDITDRKRVEKSLQSSEGQYRSLVENMEDIVFIIDSDHVILFANYSLLTFLSKTSHEIVGRRISDVLKEKNTPVIEETLDGIIRSGHGEKIDVQIDFKQFPLWFEFSFIPQPDEGGSLFSILCIGRDTTERIQYEIDLKESINKLRQQRKQLQRLTNEMVYIQEGERKKISLELHDDIGQAMTAINMTLESIRSDVTNEKTLENKVKNCQSLVGETANKIHCFSLELRPPELDDLGLISALKSHSRKFSDRSGIHIKITSDNLVEQLDTNIKIAFYRIFQEGLNNVAKHAEASEINISFIKENGSLLFNIEDNGKGFDPLEIDNNISGTLGLVGVGERVNALGGEFNIVSKPGKGTKLNIVLPIKTVDVL
jgi:PAS domain S-box-containing protein